MSNKIDSVIIIIICLLILIPIATFGQNNKIEWFSFNMGNGTVESYNLRIGSVVGQQFVGTAMQNDLKIISGFLADTLLRGTLVAVEDGKELPKIFSLHQNYPNPFNPSTRINFAVPKESHISLIIYDILGGEVETLVNEIVQPGYYEINYIGSRLSSGVYFYRLITDDYRSTKKFILVK